MSTRAIVALGAWAREQGGLVTTAQAAAAGVDRGTIHRLVRAGAVERIRHGVYRLTSAPWSRNDDVRAVWLQAEPGPLTPAARRAAVCRESAAGVYGIGDLFPPAFQVTVPNARRSNQPDVRFYVGELRADEIGWADGIRVTRPGRIIADLLADGYADLEHLGSIAADAVMDRLMTPQELISSCGPHAAGFGLAPGDGVSLARLMWESVTGDELTAA